MTLQEAREKLAELAKADGHIVFAHEVLAGCWDHRPEIVRWTKLTPSEVVLKAREGV